MTIIIITIFIVSIIIFLIIGYVVGIRGIKVSTDRPTLAYVLSQWAGTLMIWNGVSFLIPRFASSFHSTIASIPGMSLVLVTVAMDTISWAITVEVVFGVIIYISAVKLYLNPLSKSTWGVLVLIFSISGIVGGGGFFIGTIHGILGGVAALAWKPREAT